MQTLIRPHIGKSERGIRPPRPKCRRFSPLMLTGLVVTVVIALGAGTWLFAQSRTGTHAADNAPNPNCTLIVPPHPLTAQGLATPYQLVATDDDKGPCNEANIAQSAFVQAAIIDPATGKISVYAPLVVDKGSKPAVAPLVPQLPQGAVVGIWFGFNGAALTLKSKNNSLQDGNCVNGAKGMVFGQFAYCNAPIFFMTANQAIQAGKLTPPPLGTAKDGQPCPSTRDFSLVDQDQSDNVQTQYLATKNGRIAQFSAANQGQLDNAVTIANPSDNALLDKFVDPALGCQPWTAPDLTNNNNQVPALVLNELQAAAHQGTPVALVPSGDPMVLNNGNASRTKLNAYRIGVDQPIVNNTNDASTATYCINLRDVGAPRLFLDRQFTQQQPSPDPAAANSLFTFLAQRFVTAWGADAGLNCQGLLHQNSPIKVKKNDDGVAVSASMKNGNGNGNKDGDGNNKGNGNNNGNGDNQGNGNNNGNGNGTSTGNGNGNTQQQVDCSVNGTVVTGCSGTTTINGQSCNIKFDQQTRRVNITCPAK